MSPLAERWELARCPPGTLVSPGQLGGLDWVPARVPGTAAAALRDAGVTAPQDLDAHDWWYRTRFAAEPAGPGEEVRLELDGLATLADVHLNGELVLSSDSMFVPHRLDVGERLHGENELAIRFRALAPLLGVPRRPRARWRTGVADGGLRFLRTSIFGRAPGFAPGPAPVGPWRPVRLVRDRGLVVDRLELRPRLDGTAGVLRASLALRALGGPLPGRCAVELSGPSGRQAIELEPAPGGFAGELRVPEVARWWPHTHGEPVLHDVRITADGREVASARVGFRTLAPGTDDVERDGLRLHVNGVPVFARGAVWMPVDPIGLTAEPAALRATLESLRDAGMNVVRIPGVGVYEAPEFHDLCDELGLLVWQDLMFANFDYPAEDDSFRANVEAEVTAVLGRIGTRPSTAVVCGNSEVEQQVAMMGLDPTLGRTGLWESFVPGLVAGSRTDAIWIRSAPSGGTLPFRADAGVASYFGVGAYRLPLDDARRAGVRFASECLAFSNVGDDDATALAGVPRDPGADWDFADVRDHYLAELYGIDVAALRKEAPERYLELSRAVTGEVMAEVLGEWRRSGSPCNGAILLTLRDILPGSGWGLLDHRGRRKSAWHAVRRALAPVAVWTTDERLNGVAVHVANDRPAALRARLRIALYAGEHRVGDGEEELDLAPHATCTRDAEAILGRFADAAWSYRFGPPGHDALVASLEHGTGEPLGQAFRFPAGPPVARGELGLQASAEPAADGSVRLTVTARRTAWGVRIAAPGFAADDAGFSLEPGRPRTVTLRPCEPGGRFAGATVTALNARDSAVLP
jgi:beta-mannosidase